jgi:hypothetical protein
MTGVDPVRVILGLHTTYLATAVGLGQSKQRGKSAMQEPKSTFNTP